MKIGQYNSNLIIQQSFNKLEKYIINEDYRGYDPYDTLNSWIPFKIAGKWGPILATQFQKRNPINIRPIIGIYKEYNPKAMGLLLRAYSLLYRKTGKKVYLNQADYLFNWLINNYSTGYSGYCWGYNFPWASTAKFVDTYNPSAVVTGFVIKGIYEYFKTTKSKLALEVISSTANFVVNDLEWTKDETGYCISYTPLMRDVCYNASLLAAEVLAINYNIKKENKIKYEIEKCVHFVVSRQKDTGVWAYSEDPQSGKERMQIDFHQGYVLESIFNIKLLLKINNKEWDTSLKKGLEYFRNNQFFQNGQSLWRLPKKYPTEIHNQSQGIITFIVLKKYIQDASNFANNIATWTISNMQDSDGFFYYHKYKYHTIKIPYIRWSQAWMFLALTFLITE